MARIFRYALPITDCQWVTVPLGARLLSVAASRMLPDRVIDVWAMVPEEAPDVEVQVWIVGTGNPLPDELTGYLDGSGGVAFLGTVLTHGGTGVWHVFSAGRRP